MALAPLSQTIILTEDGSVIPATVRVTIPVAGPSTPPSFTTPASINSDGTPQVGEQLTGIDGVVAHGSISARQWLLAGTAISGATSSLYTPTQAGAYTYRVTALGTNGDTITSSSTVTVAAVTPPPDPTIDNTLADSTLPISAIPGLLDRINALDDRLTALGLAAVDPDVADAIAAVLVDLAEAIDAIDLHRTLAVVLPALEAAMTQLEEAAQNPNPQPSGQWFANSTDIFANGTDWFADGTKTGSGTNIRALLGQPSPVNEGNPSEIIRALLGQPSPALEGDPTASIRALLGQPAPANEGDPTVIIRAILGQPTPVNEGDPIRALLGQPAPVAEGNP